MKVETLKVSGKIGQLYFACCPNCKRFIVYLKDDKDDIVTCSDCKKKYKVKYPEEQ